MNDHGHSVAAAKFEPSLALPLVAPHTSVRDTMLVIDKYAKGIAVVVDDERRLVATITDGDIRRAILAGIDLCVPVMQLKTAATQRSRACSRKLLAWAHRRQR